MGNAQLGGMMSPVQMKMAKIKAIIEEIESTDSSKISTHSLSKLRSDHLQDCQHHNHEDEDDHETAA